MVINELFYNYFLFCLSLLWRDTVPELVIMSNLVPDTK